ncbi:MAG: L-aspartate oxidase [Christensenellales bacterium]
MRRYIFDAKADFLTRNTDVAIIGSGLAGLYAAYHLDPRLSCDLFTKERMEISSSSLAQGGIAAVTEKDDAFLYHFQDTINAGAGMCDEEAVHIIVEEGPGEIKQMQTMGARFDFDSNGHLLTTREGGHGMNRILHAGGDATGHEMVRTLKAAVKAKSSVHIHENSFAADVITRDGRVLGLIVLEDNKWHYYKTGYVILASGGLGQIYRYTTNPAVATGDGFAMAKRAGAVMENMEFIQFHPTGLYTPQNRNRQCFLISEAVRGEGGVLLNEAGERFMRGRHRLAELAPRDIVAREIYKQIHEQKEPFVRLDITHRPKEFLQKRFPTIYSKCLENGIDMAKSYIPVGPVQHYMMGGVKTNLFGETQIQGLLACGEVASTGVHGANRLASNSTLECLVFGRRCAQTVNNKGLRSEKAAAPPKPQAADILDLDVQEQIKCLKGVMVKYCGIVRKGEDIKLGISYVNDLLARINNSRLTSLREMELYNMASVAIDILRRAFERDCSVGAHYRADKGVIDD